MMARIRTPDEQAIELSSHRSTPIGVDDAASIHSFLKEELDTQHQPKAD